MSQIKITKQRQTASAHRCEEAERLLSLDARDADITRAKQLQHRLRQAGVPQLTADDQQGAPAEASA
jgi:hypothetical protein